MVHTILTHPGGAHKDDLLAVCVLASEYRAPVERRVPTAKDLADPGTAVVDVGGVHDAARMNFDHHHFPREHAPTCALSLVLERFGLYEQARRLCDWLEPAEWLDSRGPTQTAAWLGVPRRVVSQLHSPIDVTLLRRFSERERIEPGEPLYELLGYVGGDLLAYLREASERIELMAKVVERWSVEVGEERIETLLLPRLDPLPEEPSRSLAEYVRARDLGETIAALVYPDRRGPGYALTRYEDHPRLDFAPLDGESDVTFVHKTGFTCKTTATDPGRLQALLRRAWR